MRISLLTHFETHSGVFYSTGIAPYISVSLYLVQRITELLMDNQVCMIPGCPSTIINKILRCNMQSTRHSRENLAIHVLSEQLDLPYGRSMWCSFETA